MNRKQFIAALAEYPGVTWDHESEEQADSLQIDSPKGKIFAANGCHTIVEPFANNGGQSWKPDAYAEVVRMLKHGLYDCTAMECEICQGE